MNEYPIEFDDGKGNVISSGYLILDNPLPPAAQVVDVLTTQYWPVTLLPNGSLYTGSPTGVAPAPAWSTVPDMLGKTAAFSITLSTYCPTADSITINGTPLAGWSYNQGTTVWAYDGTSVDANPGQISWTANKAGAQSSQSNSPHYQGLGAPSTDVTAPIVPVGLAVSKASGGGALITLLPTMDPNASGGYTGLSLLAAGNANAAYKLQRRANGGAWGDLTTLAAPTKGIQWAPTLVDVGSPSPASTVTPTATGFSFTAHGGNEFTTSDSGGTYLMPVSGDFVYAIHVSALTGDAHGRICLTFRSVNPADPVNGAGSPFVSATFKTLAGGVGGSIDARATQGGQPANVGGDIAYSGTDVYLCFQRQTDASGNVNWLQYFSSKPGDLGQSTGLKSHVTQSMPTSGFVGCSFFGNGSLLSGTIDWVILSTDPAPSYTDSTATTNLTLYEYQIAGRDGAGNLSAYSASAGVTISSGLSKLTWMQGLATGTSKRTMIGIHLNYFQSANGDPNGNQANQMTGTNIATFTIPGTSVGPAIVGCTIGLQDQNITRAQNTKCIKDTLAAGKIPMISYWPLNPNGYHSATAISTAVVTTGAALNTKFLSGAGQALSGGINWGGVDEFAATLLDVEAAYPNQTYIVRLPVELNGNWFWWSTGVSNPTLVSQFLRMIVLYLRNTKGVSNMITMFNVNYGNGNYGINKTAPYPGDDVIDLVSFDGYTDTPANFLSTYQALVTIGKPIILAEVGNGNPTNPPSGDDISIFIKWAKVNAPLIIGIVHWSQGWAPINQSFAGNLAAATDAWTIGAADLPAFLN